MYPQFLEDLKTAKSYIFLEYFIAEPGKMLDAIVEILAQKAKEGVDVRLIYDDFGCSMWMYGLCTMESDVSRHCRINIIVICRKRESNVPVSSHFAH